MVPHLLKGACSGSDAQVSWEDGERVVRRGRREDDDGSRRAVLLVACAADHPSRSNLDRLPHEYGLRDDLDEGGGRRGRSTSYKTPVGPCWCSRMRAAGRSTSCSARQWRWDDSCAFPSLSPI